MSTYAAHCITADGYGDREILIFRTRQGDVDGEPVATIPMPDETVTAVLAGELRDYGWIVVGEWEQAEAGPVVAVEPISGD